jgi:RNA polymerase sigma factor (sigma-70 family)
VSVATGSHDAGIDFPAPTRARRRVPARLLRLASDERLVELLRGGSEAAFETLFDRHHRGVLGFCRHMLGSPEEAEDVVQHTFLAAYREIVGSDKPIQLRPWLYAIARNRSLTLLRTRARQATGELHEPPTEHLAAEVERRHDLRALLGDVSRLPDNQRAALVLAELADMPHEEIAEVLGCRREKVKALVFQARSSLIASRTARETSCAEIREQLTTLTGGSLRRNDVRRHLADCAGCREFRAAVRRQRRDLALVLPVAPSVGLKAAVLGGGAVAAGTAGGTAVATKILVIAAIAGGGTAAVEVETSKEESGPAVTRSSPAPAPVAAPAAPVIGRPETAHAAPAAQHGPAKAVRTSPAAPAAKETGHSLPAGTAKPSKPHGKGKALGHLKPANPNNPAGRGRPAHAGKPVVTPNAAKPTKPAKPAKPAKAAQPIKPAKSKAVVRAPKTAKVVKMPKPSKPDAAAPVLPAKAAKPDKAAKAG